jgi:hypothetical protein
MRADPTRRAADVLRRHGLATPARLLVDAHRPVAPLIGDLGAALGPMLAALPFGRGPAIADTLADESTLDRLLAELDATEAADARSE